MVFLHSAPSSSRDISVSETKMNFGSGVKRVAFFTFVVLLFFISTLYKNASDMHISVLKERNAQQPMPEPLQLPPPGMTICSDSHLYAKKEASNSCAPSIESIDIDQGGSRELVLIPNRRRHDDIIEAV